MHCLSGLRFVTAIFLLAVSPALASAQTSSFTDFSATSGGFTAVDLSTGDPTAAWVHSSTPAAPGDGTAWSLLGQTSPGSFALQSPAAIITVGTAGQVTGTFTHRFNFASEAGEDVIPHDGGLLQYRVGTGAWITVSHPLLSGPAYSGIVPIDSPNPLAGEYVFSGQSDGYMDPDYRLSSFTLGTDTAATFNVGDQIQLRFVGGFAADTTTADDPNWQIGSVTVMDATPVPEPLGLLLLAAMALAVSRTRPVTASASTHTPAS
jgi:hypothetical protein